MAKKKEKVFPAKGFVERFAALRNHSKKTAAEFLKKMGYNSVAVIQNANYPTHGLAPKFIQAFVKTYPMYSVEWFVQGTGSMLKVPEGKTTVAQKPEPVKAAAVIKREVETVIETTASHRADPDMHTLKKEVLLEDGDESSVLWDRSMEPQITPGNLVILRKVKDRLLVAFGQVYQVTTEDYRVIRKVVPSINQDHITLEAMNPAYAPISIPMDKVRELHLVIGNIARMAN